MDRPRVTIHVATPASEQMPADLSKWPNGLYENYDSNRSFYILLQGPLRLHIIEHPDHGLMATPIEFGQAPGYRRCLPGTTLTIRMEV